MSANSTAANGSYSLTFAALTSSLADGTSVSIAAGATFDVSGVGATYTFGTSASLSASGSGGTAVATIKGGSTSFTVARPITLTYDGLNPALTLSQGALILASSGTQTITVNTPYTLADGTYNLIKVTGGSITHSGATYNLAGTAGTGTIGFATGTPSYVTMTISGSSSTTTTTTLSGSDTKTYGTTSTIAATVTGGGGGTVQFYVDGVAFGSPVTLVSGSATIPSTATLAAGTHKVMAAYSGDSTHAPSAATSEATLTVNKAALEITANGDSKTYGSVKTYGSGSSAYAITGGTSLKNTDAISTVTITDTDSGGPAAAAANSTYRLTPSALVFTTGLAANYTITYKTGLLSVGPAALEITANGDSKTYGGVKTYGSGSSAYAITGGTSLKNTDAISTVTITDTDSGGLAAAAANGTYRLTPSALVFTTGLAANYTITYKTGLLSVGPAALTIAANAQSKPYGTTQATPVTGSAAFTPTGLQNGETVGTVTLAYGAGGLAATDAAGSTSTITPSAAAGGTFNANNYTISYTVGTLTVAKAALEITANGDSKTYGSVKTYGGGSSAYTVTGGTSLKNTDAISTVTITDTDSGGLDAAPVIGTYRLTPSALVFTTGSADNYNITYKTGLLTINALPVALSGSRPNNGLATADYSILSVANKVGSDNVTLASGTATLAGSAHGSQSIISVGDLALGGTAKGNYTLVDATGSVMINSPPVAQEVALSAKSGIGMVVAIIDKYTTDVDGDQCTVTGVSYTGSHHSTVSVGSDGTSVIFTAGDNSTYSESFNYTVSDGFGGTDTKTVTMTVTDGNAGGSPNVVAAAWDRETGTFTATYAGIPGVEYSIQYSAFSTGPWDLLKKVTADAQGRIAVSDTPSGGANSRYYRCAYP